MSEQRIGIGIQLPDASPALGIVYVHARREDGSEYFRPPTDEEMETARRNSPGFKRLEPCTWEPEIPPEMAARAFSARRH